MDIWKLTLILRIKMVYLSGESQEKAFEKAIEINPQNSMAWNNKGNALTNLNKSDEAIKAYDKTIEINPHKSIAWNNKGLILTFLGEYNEAIKAYDKAIEINPQDSEVLNKKNTLSKQIK